MESIFGMYLGLISIAFIAFIVYYITILSQRKSKIQSISHSRDYILSLKSKQNPENQDCMIRMIKKYPKETSSSNDSCSEHNQSPSTANSLPIKAPAPAKRTNKPRIKNMTKVDEKIELNTNENLTCLSKDWEFSEETFENKLLLYPIEYYYMKRIFEKIRSVIHEKMPPQKSKNWKTDNKSISSSSSQNLKPKKNLKCLFFNYHKKELEEKTNNELYETLKNIRSYSDLINALNQFLEMKIQNLVVDLRNYTELLMFFIRAKMKKWVSLFLKETHANNVKVSNEILDKALYLFSNIEDFEIQIDNIIIENQKKFLIANYYYQLSLMQYMQAIRETYVSKRYHSFLLKKGPNKIEGYKSPFVKKLSPNALEYMPQAKLSGIPN